MLLPESVIFDKVTLELVMFEFIIVESLSMVLFTKPVLTGSTNEFTIVVDTHMVSHAFSVLMDLKTETMVQNN